MDQNRTANKKPLRNTKSGEAFSTSGFPDRRAVAACRKKPFRLKEKSAPPIGSEEALATSDDVCSANIQQNGLAIPCQLLEQKRLFQLMEEALIALDAVNQACTDQIAAISQREIVFYYMKLYHE